MKTRTPPLLTPQLPTWGYAEIETALAKVYGAEHVQRTAFRARLKHFRKLKIPQACSEQEGARIRYAAADVFQLMVALELTEFGVAPELVAKLVRSQWEGKRRLWQAIVQAQTFRDDDNHFFVALPARFMSWTWGEKFRESVDGISYESGGEPIYVSSFRASEAAVFLKDLSKGGERMMVFDLSARIHAVEDALVGENRK